MNSFISSCVINREFKFAEGVGFEPTGVISPNGFQDRRNRPTLPPLHNTYNKNNKKLHARKDSNLNPRFWRPTFYQLNYRHIVKNGILARLMLRNLRNRTAPSPFSRDTKCIEYNTKIPFCRGLTRRKHKSHPPMFYHSRSCPSFKLCTADSVALLPDTISELLNQ